MEFPSEEDNKEFEYRNELRKKIVAKLDNFEYYGSGDFSNEELILIIDDLIEHLDYQENGEDDERDIFDCNDDKIFMIREIVNDNII